MGTVSPLAGEPCCPACASSSRAQAHFRVRPSFLATMNGLRSSTGVATVRHGRLFADRRHRDEAVGAGLRAPEWFVCCYAGHIPAVRPQRECSMEVNLMQPAQILRRGGREDEIQEGTRVKLKEDAFSENRPHLLRHARLGEAGVVAAPSRQSPAMSRLYVIVHFGRCGHDHRLLPQEIELA